MKLSEILSESAEIVGSDTFKKIMSKLKFTFKKDSFDTFFVYDNKLLQFTFSPKTQSFEDLVVELGKSRAFNTRVKKEFSVFYKNYTRYSEFDWINWLKSDDSVDDSADDIEESMGNDVVQIKIGSNPLWIKKIDGTHVQVYGSESNYNKNKGAIYHIIQLSHNKFYSDLKKWLSYGDNNKLDGKTYTSVVESVISDNPIVNTIQKGIKSPFVLVTLGTNGKSLSIKVSLDPISSGKISYTNSRFINFMLHDDGSFEEVARSVKLKEYKPLTKTHVSSADKVIDIINKLIKNIKSDLNETYQRGRVATITDAKMYNSLAKSTVVGVVEGLDAFGDVVISTPTFDYLVKKNHITL